MACTKEVLKTELFVAIERGDMEEVEQIIKRFPDLINFKAPNTWTPILFATRYGHLRLVRFLVENGANIDQRNPLHAASVTNFGNYAVVKYLLEQGANPNS